MYGTEGDFPLIYETPVFSSYSTFISCATLINNQCKLILPLFDYKTHINSLQHIHIKQDSDQQLEV